VIIQQFLLREFLDIKGFLNHRGSGMNLRFCLIVHRVLTREFLSILIIKKTAVKSHYTKKKNKRKNEVNRIFKRPVRIKIKTSEPT